MSYLQNRASGVLMHISSLPGETGIGTLGKEAYSFVDMLHKNNQTYWQLLPICPTGFGDSPYQSFSTVAGNPYFIDFEELVKDGYIEHSDYELINWGSNERRVDYGLLYLNRRKVFNIIEENFFLNVPQDYEDFCSKNADWLDDYATFMAIKDKYDGAPLSLWEDGLKLREKEALLEFKTGHKKEISYYKMLQYLFFKQWNKLKKYANEKKVKIIGDLPIYVSGDSADVWASPENFFLDDKLKPREVAGCPPDSFSASGQLWGNPVYNWEHLKSTNYEWWKKRLERSLEIYDIIRIDHFRGFESFYCIPAENTTAAGGSWKKGPGMDFFKATGSLKKPVIAEDLGFLTESVRELLKETGFPGMNVLQFAFDTRDENDYFPENYIANSVVYTGTHDNDTILGWTTSAPQADVESALKYFSLSSAQKLRLSMMEAALKSVSNTCILTMQDIIGGENCFRMNTPSSQSGNWQWRATKQDLLGADWNWLSEETKKSGRA